MSYVDFDYYTTEYGGSLISENAFERLAKKASAHLDTFTFNRLKEGIEEDLENIVKDCVCDLAESLFDFESAEEAMRNMSGYVQNADGTVKGKSIASISAGGESISFSAGKGAYNDIAFNRNAQNMALFAIVRQYLSGTGLLYGGI